MTKTNQGKPANRTSGGVRGSTATRTLGKDSSVDLDLSRSPVPNSVAVQIKSVNGSPRLYEYRNGKVVKPFYKVPAGRTYYQAGDLIWTARISYRTLIAAYPKLKPQLQNPSQQKDTLQTVLSLLDSTDYSFELAWRIETIEPASHGAGGGRVNLQLVLIPPGEGQANREGLIATGEKQSYTLTRQGGTLNEQFKLSRTIDSATRTVEAVVMVTTTVVNHGMTLGSGGSTTALKTIVKKPLKRALNKAMRRTAAKSPAFAKKLAKAARKRVTAFWRKHFRDLTALIGKAAAAAILAFGKAFAHDLLTRYPVSQLWAALKGNLNTSSSSGELQNYDAVSGTMTSPNSLQGDPILITPSVPINYQPSVNKGLDAAVTTFISAVFTNAIEEKVKNDLKEEMDVAAAVDEVHGKWLALQNAFREKCRIAIHKCLWVEGSSLVINSLKIWADKEESLPLATAKERATESIQEALKNSASNLASELIELLEDDSD